jgi:hypothetical protein
LGRAKSLKKQLKCPFTWAGPPLAIGKSLSVDDTVASRERGTRAGRRAGLGWAERRLRIQGGGHGHNLRWGRPGRKRGVRSARLGLGLGIAEFPPTPVVMRAIQSTVSPAPQEECPVRPAGTILPLACRLRIMRMQVTVFPHDVPPWHLSAMYAATLIEDETDAISMCNACTRPPPHPGHWTGRGVPLPSGPQ